MHLKVFASKLYSRLCYPYHLVTSVSALQTQLSERDIQLASQADSNSQLSTQHEQLQATVESQSTLLHTTQQELGMQTACAQDLKTQLDGKNSKLQETQLQLQQQQNAHAVLEVQLKTQKGQLSASSEQISGLLADKQQLQHQVEEAASDQQQLQSKLATAKKEADRRASASKKEISELQVGAIITPCNNCCIACPYLLLRSGQSTCHAAL